MKQVKDDEPTGEIDMSGNSDPFMDGFVYGVALGASVVSTILILLS